MLINILNEVKDKIDIYYKINEDIINNYDDKNRNYETLFYLNQFKNNNIINDLNKIVESDSIKDKFNNVFNLYSKMNIDEISINYEIKEYHQKQVKIFGKEFVERNKKNCKIIINDEQKELKEFLEITRDFEIENDEKNYFIIKFHWEDNLTDLSYMFADCSDIISISNAKNLINNNVTNLSNFFRDCESLRNINDISCWNTENVSNMSSLFRGCKSLDNLVELWNWKTSNVIMMSSLFYGCEKLTQLNISEWDISNVKSLSGMFYGCTKLQFLPDLSKWDTSNVTNMELMFYDCKSLTYLLY